MGQYSTEPDTPEPTGRRSRRRGPIEAVAAIGTLVASAGVAHAMYAALSPNDQRVHGLALAEALTAALFLDLVVASCARRAKTHARDARAARLDVAVVLAAALLSGLVSGIHAGWSVAGLFRFAVPTIAALVWLGDVVTVLRSRRETDHERALRAVLAAVGRRTEAGDTTGPPLLRRWRLRRADVALVRAMSVYAAADGDRTELVGRVNEMHHRTDLLGPLGPSPWRQALPTGVGTLPLPGLRLGPAFPGAPWVPWAPPTGPVPAVPDRPGQALPDPLLPVARSLVSAVPDLSRPRLIEALRREGHRVGNDRAAALLRAAKTPVPDRRSGVPDRRVNGSIRTLR